MTRRASRLLGTTALAAIGALLMGQAASAATTINYALWDDRQLPAYQACADAFAAKQSDITVKVTQTGWNDYWTNLNVGLASGTAPDVFVNQLSFFPQFAGSDQLLDMEETAQRDGVDFGIFEEGLADAWTKDGKRFGMPKDFNGIGIAFNADVISKAGVAEDEVSSLTWNPQDGGTFEQFIRRLTVDGEGRNALDPAFDKASVQTYGISAPDAGNHYGQQDWGNLAASLGVQLVDKNPFGSKYQYDDPRVAETLGWFRRMIEAGVMMSPDQVGGIGNKALFESGKIATSLQGDWNLNDLSSAGVPIKFASMPAGPEGVKTNFNGVADSIYVGTQYPAEAWEWVKFLGSSECQSIVAAKAVNFPAIKADAEKAYAAFSEKGIDTSRLKAQLEVPNSKWSIPITDHGAEINQIVAPALTNILLGRADPAEALAAANVEVNALFE